MKIQTECVPCLLKRIIFEVNQSTDDKALQTKVIRNACKMLSEIYDPNECSAIIATKIHKMVYDTLGDEDPYAELKINSNLIAKSLLPKIEELIKKSDDPLKTSMICSIIGNLMDFGIDGASTDPKMLKDVFEETYSEGLGYDDYPKLKKHLKVAKHVILFTDNCGEIVFDKVLCRELKKFNPSIFITLVVRGKPIISDATLEDVQELNFKEVVDEILTTGCFAIGVDFNLLPPKLEGALKRADLIICKGMANYEAFSETEYKPIAYLLRTKCSAIANSINISLDVNAIKVIDA
ncbi:MAG: DUF89 family protein [Thermoplasmatales archaeon]|nr:DUF89 family protein [Thermoplasmatales archaeon]